MTLSNVTIANKQFEKDLLIGTYFEDIIVNLLNVKGIPSERPDYSHLEEVQDSIERVFAREQKDISVDDDIILEVKSRKNAFKYPDIFVGKKSTWDLKTFDPKFLIVVDQDTHEVRVCRCDKESRKNWKLVKAFDKGLTYSVPIELFKPFDYFVEKLREYLHK